MSGPGVDPAAAPSPPRGAPEASGLALRPEPEAFEVEEIPAYLPSGAGEHLYLDIRKRGLTTDALAALLARLCARPLGAVGFAGRKDRRAVTRQWFSVQGVSAELGGELRERLARELAPGSAELLAAQRHGNKLRLGHLRGNRFRLRLAGAQAPGVRAELDRRLGELAERGLPNRFGAQRFGSGGSTLRIARAWARGELWDAVAALVAPEGDWTPGAPLPPPRGMGPERRVLGALRARPDDPLRALRAAGHGFRQLVASSAQSAIFNAVLEARAAELGLHALRPGDLYQGPGTGVFRCRPETLAELQERAAPGRLEIAASGPLPGRSRFEPDPPIAAQEREWSRGVQLEWSCFEAGPLESAGARRALVVGFLEPPELLEPAPGELELRFALPKGSYATELLAELGVRGRRDGAAPAE